MQPWFSKRAELERFVDLVDDAITSDDPERMNTVAAAINSAMNENGSVLEKMMKPDPRAVLQKLTIQYPNADAPTLWRLFQSKMADDTALKNAVCEAAAAGWFSAVLKAIGWSEK
jgi:phosphoribosylformylglycinamidine (FGAM) synthase-like amidotransferase family enzyme